jgi:phage terminase small subunit
MAAMTKILPPDDQYSPRPKQVRLHPRHRKFVEYYLKTGNAKQSALSAGYSPTCAGAVGCNLLKLPKIKHAIDSRLDKWNIKADNVLQEVANIAFGRVNHFMGVDENGDKVIDFSDTLPEQFAALAEYREDATGGDGDGERRRVVRRTIKMQPKMHALEALMDHLHLRDQRVEVDIGDQLAERLQRARTRTIDALAPEQGSASATPEDAQVVINAHTSNQLVNTHIVRDDSFDGVEQHETALAQTSTSLPPWGGGEGDITYMENLAPRKVGDAGIIESSSQLVMSFEQADTQPEAQPSVPAQLGFPW